MDYADLHGLLFINGADVYVSYRVFLCENSQSDHTNMEELKKPAPMKTNAGVNIREERGRRYSQNLKPTTDERTFTLYFACHGDTKEEFLQNYMGFINFIKSGLNGTGWLNITLPDIPGITFRCFVESASEFDDLTYMNEGYVASRFKVVFREPVPNF